MRYYLLENREKRSSAFVWLSLVPTGARREQTSQPIEAISKFSDRNCRCRPRWLDARTNFARKRNPIDDLRSGSIAIFAGAGRTAGHSRIQRPTRAEGRRPLR